MLKIARIVKHTVIEMSSCPEYNERMCGILYRCR